MEAAGTLKTAAEGLAADFPATEELILEDTEISSIEAGRFKDLSGLKKLSFIRAGFSGGGISSLAFEGLTQLTELTLSENANDPPMVLPFKVFLPLSGLRKLDLSRNHLPGESISENVLQGLSGLETLDLSFNKLDTLSGNQLQRLTSLKTLSLRSSGVLVLTLTTFTGLTKLESLDISGNPTMILSDDALSPFLSLKSINLNSNQLPEFRSEVLAPVKATLEDLDLSVNDFGTFKDNQYGLLSNLKVLNLSAMINPVHKIEADAFTGLSSLVTLDLRRNQMSHIQPDSFKNIPQAEIKLEGNSFFCNCEVAGVHQWLMQDNPKTDVVCMMPFRLRGKSLKTMDLVDDIGCKTPKLIVEEKIRANEGLTASFECGMKDYHGYPKVTYRVVSGSPLPSNRTTIRVVNTTSTTGEFTLKYVFTVTRVSSSDSGLVECSGSGGFGSSKATIDIFYGQEGLPLWTIIVIIVCVVVVFAVIVITVIVVKKKKTKKKSEKYLSVPRHSYVA
ncbi:chondroadherin-like protein [Lineus longissimus]|uniref:chondroadherin-like protein n=1 Tax=Lineus longissimus TaxID=88925 RepID=UPI00315C63D0